MNMSNKVSKTLQGILYGGGGFIVGYYSNWQVVAGLFFVLLASNLENKGDL